MQKSGLKCKICRKHFIEYIKKNPLENNMYIYVFDLHNNINKRRGHKLFCIKQYDEMYKKSLEFEEKLKFVCKPLYIFYQEKNLEKFPNEINDIYTMKRL